MERDPWFLFGFVIGICLGVVLRVLTAHRQTVVRYDAVDHEHGPIHVEVVSNRLTGRLTRNIYFKDP